MAVIAVCQTAAEWRVAVSQAAAAGGTGSIPFYQTYTWGAFEAAAGDTVWRLTDHAGNAVQIVVHYVGRGFCYAWAPRAVSGAYTFMNAVAAFLQTQHPRIIFLLWEHGKGCEALGTRPADGAWRTAPGRLPEATRIIDLTVGVDALRGALKPKMRYNIGLAARRGVVCSIEHTPDMIALKDAYMLITRTARRQGFRAISAHHMTRLFHFDGMQIFLACARLEQKIIAANILLGTEDGILTYLHGGSDDRFRGVMAPHALQWACIQWGVQQGYRRYDLWGIALPGMDKEKKWAGITAFKEGLGGAPVRYGQTEILEYNRILSRAYRLVRG